MSEKDKLDNIDIIFIKDNNCIWYNNNKTPNIYNFTRNDLQIQEKIFSIYNNSFKRNKMIKNMKKKFNTLSENEFNFFCLLFDTPENLSNYIFEHKLLRQDFKNIIF